MTDQTTNASEKSHALFAPGPDGYQDGMTYEIHRPERSLIETLSLDEFANWDGRDEIALVGRSKASPRE